MDRDVFTFLIGGKAGEGVKKVGAVAARLFSDMGRQAVQMDDYQSLIKGGHNFTIVSSAPGEITSHYPVADLIVSLDQRSYDTHKGRLAKGGVMVHNSDSVKDAQGPGAPLSSEAKRYPNPELRVGLGGLAALCAAVGLDKPGMTSLISKEYPRDTENNIAYAGIIFDLLRPKIGNRFTLARGDRPRRILTGNEAIALGMAAGGLDVFYAYPMTPTTSILHFLASRSEALGITVVHPENEIAVANMAIGTAFTGARAALASSGGGFALMQEAISLAGMVEAPLLCILSSRPGPSTGMPTYTEQADLDFALHQGHGDITHLVASPGTQEEAFYLAARMLDIVWRFQTPGILLTEKHLSEGSRTVEIDPSLTAWASPLMHEGGAYKRYLATPDGISPMLFPPSKELIKWNSYEHDELGITTEDGALTVKMKDKRRAKSETMREYLKTQSTVNVWGVGGTGPTIFTYGSTTMSVLESLRCGGIEATVVQPIFLEPFPVWEAAKFGKGPAMVVEQSCTGQFASLLWEKAGIKAKAVIKRYDGRPFEPRELGDRIKEAL